jgi:hypothetical protein
MAITETNGELKLLHVCLQIMMISPCDNLEQEADIVLVLRIRVFGNVLQWPLDLTFLLIAGLSLILNVYTIYNYQPLFSRQSCTTLDL